MNDSNEIVNPTLAPIKNVALCSLALEQAINRPSHLPGMVCFYGPSGWGKSTAAAYTANKHNAYYVECKSSWTKGALLDAILKEMGIVPGKMLYQKTEQASEQLAKSCRPLIIDELDHIVHKKAVEIIRDLYDGSNAPILLIGEDDIETKLLRWERFHNRVLVWQPAQPADLEDTRKLAKLYCKHVEIADDLLTHAQQQSLGNTTRICINLYKVQQEALNMGLSAIDRDAWGDREFYTGNAPRRKV
ncbi:MAG: ATP-binding protein [Candidatus Sedimenticola sp. (ex Thyasira tokunagai)]